MALISGKMTYFAFYVTTFLIGLLLGMHSYSLGGEKTDSWEVLYLYHDKPVGSFVWWSYQSRKETPR